MADETPTTPAPKKPKKPPQRRSYMTLHADLTEKHTSLEARVAMAARLLKRAGQPADNGENTFRAHPCWLLVEAAIETLEGE